MTSGDVSRYADEAMFLAQYVPAKPEVTVVDMTYNPLRVMAAVWRGYQGEFVTADDITQAMAIDFAKDCLKSKIAAPLEWCQIALLIRGVSRDFTHQIVRQRTATFVQESMRFAVKENSAAEIPIPWSISRLSENDDMLERWL